MSKKEVLSTCLFCHAMSDQTNFVASYNCNNISFYDLDSGYGGEDPCLSIKQLVAQGQRQRWKVAVSTISQRVFLE